MATTLGLNDAHLSAKQRTSLESIRAQFCKSWTSSRLADAADALPRDDVAFFTTALMTLICEDMSRQWTGGRPLNLEWYLEEFPLLGTRETAPIELIRFEFRLRKQRGMPAELDEFERRFPGRGGELRDALQEKEHAARSVTSAIAAMLKAAPDETPPDSSNLDTVVPGNFGRYRIDRLLGAGGMATVYLAQDLQLNRPVALKIPHFTGHDIDKQVERFYREARASAHLQHANICSVFDVGEINGAYYLAVSYIEGQLLGDYAASHQLSQPQIAQLIRILALALQEAHRGGVIHRDLKPANIMVNRRGEPVVMDFGLAWQLSGQPVESITRTGTVIGTPAYMALEQMQGDRAGIGPATDIYSLGVILYELLTGKLPYEGNPAQVIAEALAGKPLTPREVRGEIDPAIEAICLKMMARNSQDRYPTMLDLANVLEAFLEDQRQQGVDSAAVKLPGAAIVSAANLDEAPQLLVPTPQPQAADAKTPPAPPPATSRGRRRIEQDARQASSAEQAPSRRAALIVTSVGVMLVMLLIWAIVNNRPQGPSAASPLTADATRFWSQQSPEPGHAAPHRATLIGRGEPIRALDFSKDGGLLAAGDQAGGLRVWNLSTGKLAVDLQLDGPATALRFSDAGELLTAGSSGVVQTWNLTDDQPAADSTGRRLVSLGVPIPPPGAAIDTMLRFLAQLQADAQRTAPDSPQRLLAVSPDWQSVAVAGRDGGSILVWSTAQGSGPTRLAGQESQIVKMSFSPGGGRLAAVQQDGVVRIWDVTNGQELRSLPSPGRPPSCLLFSPEGDRLATSNGEGGILLWRVSSNKPPEELHGHAAQAQVLAFSPDGRCLASGSDDGEVKIWEVVPPTR